MCDQQERKPDFAQIRKKKKRRNIIFTACIAVGLMFIVFISVVIGSAIFDANSQRTMRKPVIYLYPETVCEVSVELDFEGVTVTYPEYDEDNGGWRVTAYPDGTLLGEEGREYSYLFWEAENDMRFDFSEGFCVKGSETEEFLRWALSEQGLTPKEYNELIVYWLPLMIQNPYNIISFQGENYNESAPLKITPEPDNVKRVFMAYYPSDVKKDIPEQELEGFERNGFTVVEWGGACIENIFFS